MKSKLCLYFEAVLLSLCCFSMTAEQQMMYDIEYTKLELRYKDSLFGIKYLNMFNQLDSELRNKWIYELNSNQTQRISFVENDKHFKILGEAWLDSTKQFTGFTVLSNNLEFAKSNGYNTILVRFDCSEDKTRLLQMIRTIKSNGLMVASTYTGRNFFKHTFWHPYIEPSQLREYIKTVAENSDAWFLNWRCMSVHEILVPREFFHLVCDEVRKSNSTIPIYGEVFKGLIAYGNGIDVVLPSYVKNINGYVLVNSGFYGKNMGYDIRTRYPKMIEGFVNSEKIGVVVGHSAYYKSINNKKLSSKEELECKKTVEQQFELNGCMTVTYMHDGIDDDAAGKYNTTDNMVYDTEYTKGNY